MRLPRTSADIHRESYARDQEWQRRGLLTPGSVPASASVANPLQETSSSAHEESHSSPHHWVVWVQPAGIQPVGAKRSWHKLIRRAKW
jgi:hypothetical protein